MLRTFAGINENKRKFSTPDGGTYVKTYHHCFFVLEFH